MQVFETPKRTNCSPARILAVALALIWLAPPAAWAQLATSSIQISIAPSPVDGIPITAARSYYEVIAQVDAADQIAHEAQRYGVEARAEATLDTTLYEGWRSIAMANRGVVRVDEPLTLALLALHIEVRRSLGADFHTVVPGLVDDTGCAGDIVGDRLIFSYGEAIHDIRASADSSHAVATDFARQIACLGDSQLHDLDDAISDGFETVIDDLAEHGLSDLTPAVARAVAPLMVLVLDARKNAGENSDTWFFFAIRGEELRADVTAAGWPTGELLVWDRVGGRLIGYPECEAAVSSERCVQLATFLNSLEDPRALGLGDCAFAGMVAQGIKPVGRDVRYTCPMNSCDEGKRTSFEPSLDSDQTREHTDQIARTWPTTTEQQRDEMTSLCKPDGTNLQGVPESAGSCAAGDATSSGSGSPFDSELACVADAIGVTKEAGLDAPLRGVPMGDDCRLTDGQGDVRKKQKAWAQKADKWARRAYRSGMSNAIYTSPDYTVVVEVGPQGIETAAFSPGEGVDPVEAARLAVRDLRVEAVEGKTRGQRQIAYAAINDIKTTVAMYVREGRIDSLPEWVEPEGQDQDVEELEALPDPEEEYFDWLGPLPDGDCIDPGFCGNSCSALGRQIGAVESCTGELLDELADAYGQPTSDISGGITWVDDLGDPLPEDGHEADASDFGACLGDEIGLSDPGECALMLCEDGLLASGVDGSCDCGDQRFDFTPERIWCTELRCAPGEVPNQFCGCEPADWGDPSGPDGPGGGEPDPTITEEPSLSDPLTVDDPTFVESSPEVSDDEELTIMISNDPLYDPIRLFRW